jgi:hypothetical protein
VKVAVTLDDSSPPPPDVATGCCCAYPDEPISTATKAMARISLYYLPDFS